MVAFFDKYLKNKYNENNLEHDNNFNADTGEYTVQDVQGLAIKDDDSLEQSKPSETDVEEDNNKELNLLPAHSNEKGLSNVIAPVDDSKPTVINEEKKVKNSIMKIETENNVSSSTKDVEAQFPEQLVATRQNEDQETNKTILRKEVQTNEQANVTEGAPDADPNSNATKSVVQWNTFYNECLHLQKQLKEIIKQTQALQYLKNSNFFSHLHDIGSNTTLPISGIYSDTTGDESKSSNDELRFHKVHGDNIILSEDGFRAERLKKSNFINRGIAFSSRPVRVNEKICLRLEQRSGHWLGNITFGFTNNDPDTLAEKLSASIISDRKGSNGYWASYLDDTYCRESNNLHYFLNSSGNMCFGINGVDRGKFLWKLDTLKPLWAVMDISECCTAVELDDPKRLLSKKELSDSIEKTDSNVTTSSKTMDRVNACMDPPETSKLLPLKYQSNFVPLDLFMEVKASHVQYLKDQGICVTSDIKGGQIFVKKPMFPGQIIIVQNLSAKKIPQVFSIGINYCDPQTKISKKVKVPEPVVTCVALQYKDECAITFTTNGIIQVTKNLNMPKTLLMVNLTDNIWPFITIHRRNQMIRIWSNNITSRNTNQS